MSVKKRAARKGSGASGALEVSAFMAELEHPRTAEIQALRALIRSVDSRIEEGIKWNAPSYSTAGQHFATLRVRPGDILQIVFHTGAKPGPTPIAIRIDDPGGLLRWPAPDRAVMTLGDMADLRGKEKAIVSIVRQWLSHLP
ncbi:MAG TPA: DUF1801 domain-containing protein [Gemmatimonadales bacterium]|nr:DUF1801 domain-containing protein [Gemmatimonadales bacterium]